MKLDRTTRYANMGQVQRLEEIGVPDTVFSCMHGLTMGVKRVRCLSA